MALEQAVEKAVAAAEGLAASGPGTGGWKGVAAIGRDLFWSGDRNCIFERVKPISGLFADS